MHKWEYLRYKWQERLGEFKLRFSDRFSRKGSGGYRGYQHGKMSVIRDWINEHRYIPMILCGILIFVLAIVLTLQIIPDRTQPAVTKNKKAWYYDLNTAQLFAAEKGLLPPVKAPSGLLADGTDAGVIAHVRTYAQDPTETDLVVVYLETLTIDAKLQIEESVAAGKASEKPWYYGRSVKRPADSKWHQANTAEARMIMHKVSQQNTEGQSPRYSFPK